MNIVSAKEEIKRTVEIYLDRNETGEYVIPYMKQRPIFLIGAPGIGKTAVVEQVAAELDLGLVAYSMTHHTRQSAIGLPFISERDYGGAKTRISEYTMSEIIASVYDMMERTGKDKGILFLDEINCVSETLSPAILQFLQYKTFGNHFLPKGWVIVSAGNPPQYNRSVREFDIATRDRLKCISIEEDYEVWRKYAYDNHIHSSITAFLEVNRNWFYSIKTTAEGAQFATARGWEDMSFAIKEYEKKQFPVDMTLISQYITDLDIARKYTVYYDLYKKYREDYKVDSILDGTYVQSIEERARNAEFDERIALVEMIFDALNMQFTDVMEKRAILENTADVLRDVRQKAKNRSGRYVVFEILEKKITEINTDLENRKNSNSIMPEQYRIIKGSTELLCSFTGTESDTGDDRKDFPYIKKKFDSCAVKQDKEAKETGKELDNAFSFMEKVWPNGRELMYFMTILTAGRHSSSFIAGYGCDAYYRHNDDMLLYDVREELKREITLELEGEATPD